MYKWEGVLVVVVLVAIGLVRGSDRYDDKDGVHTMTRGTRKMVKNKHADTLLFHESVKVDGTLFPFPMVHSQDVCYPHKKRDQAKFTITAFNLEDAGKGGLAYMKKDGGGIGKHKVCFHLKSPRGSGYNFNIDVWGYYN